MQGPNVNIGKTEAPWVNVSSKYNREVTIGDDENIKVHGNGFERQKRIGENGQTKSKRSVERESERQRSDMWQYSVYETESVC